MSRYKFNPKKYEEELKKIITELINLQAHSKSLKKKKRNLLIDRVLKQNPKDKTGLFSRDQLVQGVDMIIEKSQERDFSDKNAQLKQLRSLLKMKPTRTISGVTTVTVLTKPWMCPGKCVFCPNDVRMPKSYIATEPGAQRALANKFSPYLQTFNRLRALDNIGHPTDKIELLVLGGTWSSYPEKYQVWFVKECFRAMNEFKTHSVSASKQVNKEDRAIPLSAEELKEYLQNDYNEQIRAEEGSLEYNQLVKRKSFLEKFQKDYVVEEDYNFRTPVESLWEELEKHHNLNSKGKTRCVGLVLETRPDAISEKEVVRLRKLGATKIQLGIQTLNDKISDLNQRGEYKKDTAKAFGLLRSAGFKIHAHMMPNLHGANPDIDLEVHKELFESENYKPDELKIYPTSLIKNTELNELYDKGEYKPYSTETLIDLVANMMELTPEYCRITRVIRDIPSTEIEAGNMTTNLREVVEHKLKIENRKNPNIRAREVKNQVVKAQDLTLDVEEYKTTYSTEYFLQCITKERKIAGFLRLSFPLNAKNGVEGLEELNECAIIREVHIYGPSLKLSNTPSGEAQHLGLGTKLINKAKEISKEKGFEKLAVISAIGTREYYEKRGFELKNLYQIATLTN